MLRSYKIIAIIPARSGSKEIPDKNIMNYKGAPLMVHSILQGLESKYIDEVILSTDSELYRDIGVKFGVNAPYLRPKNLSHDTSTDYDFILYHVKWLKEKGISAPDLIVQLRPTYPTRKVSDIDKAIKIFVSNYNSIDSLRSVVKASISPYKMWKYKNKLLSPVISEGESYNSPRQTLEDVYWQNACIDIVKLNTITQLHSVSGKRIMPFFMDEDEVFDIDSMKDFEKI